MWWGGGRAAQPSTRPYRECVVRPRDWLRELHLTKPDCKQRVLCIFKPRQVVLRRGGRQGVGAAMRAMRGDLDDGSHLQPLIGLAQVAKLWIGRLVCRGVGKQPLGPGGASAPAIVLMMLRSRETTRANSASETWLCGGGGHGELDLALPLPSSTMPTLSSSIPSCGVRRVAASTLSARAAAASSSAFRASSCLRCSWQASRVRAVGLPA